MNTRQAIQPSNTPAVLSISFSASRNRFITGLTDGFRIFRSDNCLTTCSPSLPFDCSAAVVEVLDDRYLAFVAQRKVSGAKGPNTVVFWDSTTGTEISNIDFYEPILAVRLRSKWMAVILEERTVLFQYQKVAPQASTISRSEHDTSDDDDDAIEPEMVQAPNIVHSLHPTSPNRYALACLRIELLALPSQSTGQVQLIMLSPGSSSNKRVLRAHNSSIRAMEVSDDETLLATASEQGTLIRVFNTKTLNQIAEFRRGVDHAIIYSLAFSPGQRWVASTSDKGTLHVFDLRPPDPAAVANAVRDRDAREKQHRKSQPYTGHRLCAPGVDKDSLSGISGDRSSPAPSTAIGTAMGTGYQGSVQEYYGLRPPPTPTAPPARDAAISAMAAFKASSFAPRIFKDARSTTSAPFYTGSDPPHWQGGPSHTWTTAPNGTRKRVKNPIQPLPNNPSGRPPKGAMTFKLSSDGIADDDNGATIYVIGGGVDARWEAFDLLPATSRDGTLGMSWILSKRGFRKYLTRQFVD